MDNPNPLTVTCVDSKRQKESQLNKKVQEAQSTLAVADYQMLASEQHPLEKVRNEIEWRGELMDEEPITREEIFDMIRDIMDPEHPLSLEQLSVVYLDGISVDHEQGVVCVEFCPTIPHCSQATMIGLMLRVKLSRCLPPRFKIQIRVKPGTHHTEDAINKQLNDKERVAAALENGTVLNVINHGILSREEPFFLTMLEPHPLV